MATTATITPTLGSAPVTLQAGNYSAIDDRRFWGSGLGEGYLSTGSYQVIQRAAGANMTVDVASSVGEGAVVTGDSVTAQGKYFVPPTAANVNVDIATADATNPRNDLVVLEIKDDQHDASGLNLARVRVITGTPNASAALTDAPGANGTPALPSSCMPLAVVNVTAGLASVATARISDRRTSAKPYAVLGRTTSSTGFVTTATHTDYKTDTNVTTSVTYAASRILRVQVFTHVYCSGGLQNVLIGIFRGSTQIAESFLASAGLSNVDQTGVFLSHTFSGPTVGATESFTLQIRAGTSNTAVNSYATPAQLKCFTVEDLGPQ